VYDDGMNDDGSNDGVDDYDDLQAAIATGAAPPPLIGAGGVMSSLSSLKKLQIMQQVP
jgi:hypothetical protein